jgi:hypothetical protein
MPHSEHINTNQLMLFREMIGNYVEKHKTHEAVQRHRWLCAGSSPRISGLDPMPFHVRFVENEVAVGQCFLRVVRCSPVIIIPPVLRSHSVVSRRRYVTLRHRR